MMIMMMMMRRRRTVRRVFLESGFAGRGTDGGKADEWVDGVGTGYSVGGSFYGNGDFRAVMKAILETRNRLLYPAIMRMGLLVCQAGTYHSKWHD